MTAEPALAPREALADRLDSKRRRTPLARHQVVDYLDCSERQRLDDPDALRRALLEAAERIGATVVGQRFHQFAPQGVTGVIMLAESHLAVHTWPEEAYAAVDLFTCGRLDPAPGIDYLARFFGAGRVDHRSLDRGPRT